MIEFEIRKHKITDKQVVEVRMNGIFVASIIANSESGIRLLSAHLDKHWFDDGSAHPEIPVPAVNISFDPKPFRIEDGRIVRER